MTWIELESIILSEVSQKDKYHMFRACSLSCVEATVIELIKAESRMVLLETG